MSVSAQLADTPSIFDMPGPTDNSCWPSTGNLCQLCERRRAIARTKQKSTGLDERLCAMPGTVELFRPMFAKTMNLLYGPQSTAVKNMSNRFELINARSDTPETLDSQRQLQRQSTVQPRDAQPAVTPSKYESSEQVEALRTLERDLEIYGQICRKSVNCLKLSHSSMSRGSILPVRQSIDISKDSAHGQSQRPMLFKG